MFVGGGGSVGSGVAAGVGGGGVSLAGMDDGLSAGVGVGGGVLARTVAVGKLGEGVTAASASVGLGRGDPLSQAARDRTPTTARTTAANQYCSRST